MESTAKKSALSDRFWFGATAIFILAVALRQWHLGDGPFHPDEAIHAFFAGGFRDYHYDPIYHGPLLYHLVAAVFGIFHEFDYTARLVPSLLGILLITMVLGPARQFLGNRGALASAALLAVSPSLVTYSRHLLHDALALVLTLGAALCLLVSLNKGSDTEGGRYARIGVATFLVLFLATKANCFFIAVMLGAFTIAWWLRGTLKLPLALTKWVPFALFFIVSAASYVYPRDNTSPDAQKLAEHALFQVIALVTCAVMGLWLLTGERNAPEPKAVEKPEGEVVAEKEVDPWTTYVLAIAAVLWLYLFLFGNGAQVLIQLVQDRAFPSATFAKGIQSAQSAIPDMLKYWGGQQKTPRLPGRHDYYFVLILLYEVPIFLAALGGIWHASKNRSTFSDLLVWWAFTSWTIYAVANEKVPWLLVHTLLPFALLGGLWLGQIRWNKGVLSAAVVAGLFFSLRSVSATNFERAGDNIEPILYAQTPDAFRDLLREDFKATQGDDRSIYLADDRQWPTVWYLGKNEPYVGKSVAAIGVASGTDPLNYRVMVGDDTLLKAFDKEGWQSQHVDFLIWPRASWYGLAPQRYFRWFWTRDTLPKNERDLPQKDWKYSILGGKGEWSHAVALIGRPGNPKRITGE